MKLLLDTNIIVDIISKRDGYEGSLEVLRCCEANLAYGFVSAITVTDVMYILRKHIAPDQVRDAVQTLLSIIDVEDVTKSDIMLAFTGDVTDYEDAVQVNCAARLKADYIVTRNIKDFTHSSVKALLPEQVLGLLISTDD